MSKRGGTISGAYEVRVGDTPVFLTGEYGEAARAKLLAESELRGGSPGCALIFYVTRAELEARALREAA